MFTSATRAAIEKIQQQYGLPVNGIWGSLERQVFDNARVRTLPPSSAASLMPPDYNRTTDAVKYQKAVVSQRPAPAASKLSKTFPTATIPTDVSGIVTCAAAGFLTAAVLTKADSARRARLPPSAAARDPARRRRRRRGGALGETHRRLLRRRRLRPFPPPPPRLRSRVVRRTGLFPPGTPSRPSRRLWRAG